MSQNGSQPSPQASPAFPHASQDAALHRQVSETSSQLTKSDLDASLTIMYEKLANKFHSELKTSTSTLQQEIASLGGRTDLLETKHDELSLAHNDLRKLVVGQLLLSPGSR